VVHQIDIAGYAHEAARKRPQDPDPGRLKHEQQHDLLRSHAHGLHHTDLADALHGPEKDGVDHAHHGNKQDHQDEYRVEPLLGLAYSQEVPGDLPPGEHLSATSPFRARPEPATSSGR